MSWILAATPSIQALSTRRAGRVEGESVRAALKEVEEWLEGVCCALQAGFSSFVSTRCVEPPFFCPGPGVGCRAVLQPIE